ncbi:S1/P1 nuclease [Inquilinus sp. CA228]|uniref:S1/P1 nuclease n=1 Tax=Inquilinus sp. CA228 TaxID=3455609 RepID=UPI003F8D8E41
MRALPLKRWRQAGLTAMLMLVLLMPHQAMAWLRDGHMATATLAYDMLEQRDPEAIAVILRLMRAHPDRARFDAQLGGLSGRAGDRRMFELMAIWPDAVRNTPYDHPSWHTSQRIVSSARSVIPFAFGGAQSEFGRNLAVAHDATASDSDRAVALCWVMHIVGDMHQPLHTAMWMSWRFPITDAGGQWAWVRRSPGAEPERLHRFWDAAGHPDALTLTPPGSLEAKLEPDPPADVETLSPDPETAFAHWVAHTRELAYEVAYARGRLRAGKSASSARVLPPDYVERAQAVSRVQLTAAGRRIGALLSGLR